MCIFDVNYLYKKQIMTKNLFQCYRFLAAPEKFNSTHININVSRGGQVIIKHVIDYVIKCICLLLGISSASMSVSTFTYDMWYKGMPMLFQNDSVCNVLV